MAYTFPSRGFTLVELAITMAIVAILSAIAYPTYHQYVLKGRRAEGRAALTAVLQQQERYYTQYGKYFISQGNDNGPFKAYSGDNLSTSAYTLTSARCADNLSEAECVQITAVPTRNDDPEVGNLAINSVGPTRTCSGPKKDLCWK